jgi:hypothetical protein
MDNEKSSVVDRHRSDDDLDADPNSHVDADPDPDPDWHQNNAILMRILPNFNWLEIRICFYF